MRNAAPPAAGTSTKMWMTAMYALTAGVTTAVTGQMMILYARNGKRMRHERRIQKPGLYRPGDYTSGTDREGVWYSYNQAGLAMKSSPKVIGGTAPFGMYATAKVRTILVNS